MNPEFQEANDGLELIPVLDEITLRFATDIVSTTQREEYVRFREEMAELDQIRRDPDMPLHQRRLAAEELFKLVMMQDTSAEVLDKIVGKLKDK